jgi:hypothetical protein
MSSKWSASDRYQLAPAPGGLALVQDFLNTVAIGDYGPDLLGDVAPAQEWAANAVQAWAHARGTQEQAPMLSGADIPRLLVLRATVADLLDGEWSAGTEIGVSSTYASSANGALRLAPAGRGWRWLASALWGEILLAQQTGEWRRLKQCHNPACRSTFFDRSKNNSGVWHNAKTCGNAANLRASRARRRQAHCSG